MIAIKPPISVDLSLKQVKRESRYNISFSQPLKQEENQELFQYSIRELKANRVELLYLKNVFHTQFLRLSNPIIICQSVPNS